MLPQPSFPYIPYYRRLPTALPAPRLRGAVILRLFPAPPAAVWGFAGRHPVR